MEKIKLQAIGEVPAIKAEEIKVGDTLVWNFGHSYDVVSIQEASPKFLYIEERDQKTGKVYQRRIKKNRLVGVDREDKGMFEAWPC